MDKETVQVDIRILGKNYLVACPRNAREGLLESARLLDARMREVRESGKIIGAERVAVMAGLNIAHELLQIRERETAYNDSLGDRLNAIGERISAVLEEDRQLEL